MTTCFIPAKNSFISWLLFSFFGAVFQSYLRGCLLGYNPQYDPRTKLNSQLLGCAFLTAYIGYFRLDMKGLNSKLSEVSWRSHSHFSSVAVSSSYSLVAVRGFLITVVSLLVVSRGHGLQ